MRKDTVLLNQYALIKQSTEAFKINALLNQARAGQRPAGAWFLEITFVRKVGMRVCMCVRP